MAHLAKPAQVYFYSECREVAIKSRVGFCHRSASDVLCLFVRDTVINRTCCLLLSYHSLGSSLLGYNALLPCYWVVGRTRAAALHQTVRYQSILTTNRFMEFFSTTGPRKPHAQHQRENTVSLPHRLLHHHHHHRHHHHHHRCRYALQQSKGAPEGTDGACFAFLSVSVRSCHDSPLLKGEVWMDQV